MPIDEDYKRQADFIKENFQLVLDKIKEQFPDRLGPYCATETYDFGFVRVFSLWSYVLPGCEKQHGRPMRIRYHLRVSAEEETPPDYKPL